MMGTEGADVFQGRLYDRLPLFKPLEIHLQKLKLFGAESYSGHLHYVI